MQRVPARRRSGCQCASYVILSVTHQCPPPSDECGTSHGVADCVFDGATTTGRAAADAGADRSADHAGSAGRAVTPVLPATRSKLTPLLQLPLCAARTRTCVGPVHALVTSIVSTTPCCSCASDTCAVLLPWAGACGGLPGCAGRGGNADSSTIIASLAFDATLPPRTRMRTLPRDCWLPGAGS